MRISTSPILLALTLVAIASASAIPQSGLAVPRAVSEVTDEQLEKRAVCTFAGYTYFCAASSTTTSSTTKSTTTTTISSKVTTSATTKAATSTSTKTSSTSSATSSGSTGASQYTSGSTADDIEDDSGCTALTVIYARGTSEAGNIGSVAGPPMFKQLLSDLGASKLTLQGVDYPANTAGDTADCGAAGGPDMANLTTTILARCPNTKVALTGYSQGACVVHNAAASQGLSASQISAVVLFGDPFNGQSVGSVSSSKVLEICGSSDSICDVGGSSNVSGDHLDYGNDAAQAATFIEKTTGVTS